MGEFHGVSNTENPTQSYADMIRSLLHISFEYIYTQGFTVFWTSGCVTLEEEGIVVGLKLRNI